MPTILIGIGPSHREFWFGGAALIATLLAIFFSCRAAARRLCGCGPKYRYSRASGLEDGGGDDDDDDDDDVPSAKVPMRVGSSDAGKKKAKMKIKVKTKGRGRR